MTERIPGDEPIHPIGVVSRRTGLKPDLIRAWERRYGAVEPARTASGQRVYTEEEVARLQLLARLTHAGHTISRIADLPSETLRDLLADLEAESAVRPREKAPSVRSGVGTGPSDGMQIVESCLEAVQEMDPERLRRILDREALRLGRREVVGSVLIPLMETLGDRWYDGSISPAYEHLATAVTRGFLSEGLAVPVSDPDAPVLIVATPSGQRHELGALLAAETAVGEGWRVLYLGPDLPAEEIALAARRTSADAVAVGITVQVDEPSVGGRIREIAAHLDGVPLLVGGRALGSLTFGGDSDTIVPVRSLEVLIETLHQIAPPP